MQKMIVLRGEENTGKTRTMYCVHDKLVQNSSDPGDPYVKREEYKVVGGEHRAQSPYGRQVVMRCKNCGWDNPANLTECEKCHSVLGKDAVDDKPTTPVSDRMKSTVAEVFNPQAPFVVPMACPKCGYPVSDNSSSCPNCNYEFQNLPNKVQTTTCKSCGAEIAIEAKFCPSCGAPTNEEKPQHKHIQRVAMGTVLSGPICDSSSGKKLFCTLKPIEWEGEEIKYNPITYSGEVIILNRSNTDANNNSITSREQAVLTHEDGEWYIENRSELKTTFIRVNGRVKLTNGDIIVLGNREFEFKG